MSVETGTTIAQLDKTWPLSGDLIKEGDDHTRLIKQVLQDQFPGVGGVGFAIAIIATEEEINYLTGVTSNIQGQFNAITPQLISVIDDLVSPDPLNALSANQGVVLKGLVDTNTGNIATNTGNIATNTGNIATNTAALLLTTEKFSGSNTSGVILALEYYSYDILNTLGTDDIVGSVRVLSNSSVYSDPGGFRMPDGTASNACRFDEVPIPAAGHITIYCRQGSIDGTMTIKHNFVG